MGHRGKLAGALILTLLFLGCCAVSYSFAWYRYESTTTVANAITSRTTVLYFWTKYRVVDKADNYDDTDYNSNSTKNTKAVFSTALAFLAAASAAGLVTALFQIIGIIGKSRFFRILAGILALVATGLLAVSLFSFLRITKAFDQDELCTLDNILNVFRDSDKTMCNKFIGSIDGDIIETNWKPWVGWWVTIGGVAFAALSALSSFLA